MYTNTFDQTCREINWTELSAQKQTLMQIVDALPPSSKNKRNLDGLIKLLDKLQESATDVHGIEMEVVYPDLNLVKSRIEDWSYDCFERNNYRTIQ